MNIIFRKLKAAKNIIVRNYRWQKDGILCRKELKQKELLSLDNKRIAVLAPHSDDEWIGCSRLLLKNPNNVTVINMDMQGGDSEELHALRFEEMRSVAQKIGYELITAGKSKEEFLCRFLTENSVDVVMLPGYYDWHDEHFAVMDAFSCAAKKIGYDGLVGMYQVSLPMPECLINYASVMRKKELKRKWSDLKKYYPSQDFLPIKRFMINEHINGGIIVAYAIESYSIMHVKKWQDKYNYNKLTNEEKILLRSNLNRISFVREKLQQKERDNDI